MENQKKSRPSTAQSTSSAGPPSSPLVAFEGLSTVPDFALIWTEASKEAVTEDAFERRSIFEYNLEEEGLVLQWENNDQFPDLHIVKIWAPLEVLKRYSEILKLRLPMKQIPDSELPFNLEKKSKSDIFFIAWWEQCVNCLNLDPNVFSKKARKLTRVYSRDKEYLFDVDESNMYEIFPPALRARIVRYILRRKPYKSGESLEKDAFAIGYERLIQHNVYDAGFPLHDGKLTTDGCTRNVLYEHWGKLSTCLKYQPLEMVKDYFGENLALYFAWLGYYTRMLVFAAILGIVCFIYGFSSAFGDQFVEDVCNTSLNITMCPLCDLSCDYWKLSEKCTYSRFTHLFDNDSTVLFALLMSVWTAIFLEFWKRYAQTITHEWDLSSMDMKDLQPRPEYVSALKRFYEAANNEEADGRGRRFDNIELSIPFWRRKLPYSVVSYSTVLLLVVLAFAALSGVIVYRLWITLVLSELSNQNAKAWEGLIVSVSAAFINLTFIMIFGKVYEKIAARLTELEFPRTQPDFEASYTMKIYLLQFVNNYSSIFYVAFFKGAYAGAPHKHHRLFHRLRQEECGLSCMPELCIQLAVIMIGKQSKNMFMEAFLPFVKRVFKKARQNVRVLARKESIAPSGSIRSNKKQLQWTEDYFDLLEWGEFALVDEYLEMVLQFGFVTIFVSAFPLAPLFALINNIFELRIDAGKLLRHYRRPIGIRVKDIGAWSDIVDAIIKISVLSNACIIALTSNFVPKFVYRYILLDKGDPAYGTLHGYLNSSLTAFSTTDIESKPSNSHMPSTECSYPTRRYSSNEDPMRKYEFKEENWKIWLARVVFILLYENLVVVIILFVRWSIPDMPSRLRVRVQREERMVNELILKQELLRAQTLTSARTRHSRHTDGKMAYSLYRRTHRTPTLHTPPESPVNNNTSHHRRSFQGRENSAQSKHID